VWFKEVDTLIQQGCIKLTRNYSLLHCYRIFLFHLNAVFLNLNIFIKEFKKIITVSANTSSNKDVKKCYLRTKSAYGVISEGSCDTEDWSNGGWKLRCAITCVIIDILNLNWHFHCIFYQTLPLKYFTNPKLLNNSAQLYLFFWSNLYFYMFWSETLLAIALCLPLKHIHFCHTGDPGLAQT